MKNWTLWFKYELCHLPAVQPQAIFQNLVILVFFEKRILPASQEKYEMQIWSIVSKHFTLQTHGKCKLLILLLCCHTLFVNHWSESVCKCWRKDSPAHLYIILKAVFPRQYLILLVFCLHVSELSLYNSTVWELSKLSLMALHRGSSWKLQLQKLGWCTLIYFLEYVFQQTIKGITNMPRNCTG